MHDQGPDTDPGHEGEEVGALGRDNVVDGVGENSNGASDADDNEGLGGEEGEDDAAQHASQEDFVDAVGVVGLDKHVEREGEGWEDAVVNGKYE